MTGVDYAPTSVDASLSFNARVIAQGSCRIVEGDVMALPFADASFDVATAFETVYFWPDIRRSLSEVARVLRRGGTFMISNEVDGTAESDASAYLDAMVDVGYPLIVIRVDGLDDVPNVAHGAGKLLGRVGRGAREPDEPG